VSNDVAAPGRRQGTQPAPAGTPLFGHAFMFAAMFAALLLGCAGERPWNQPPPEEVAVQRLGPPQFEGFVDIVDCTTVHGWVRDLNAPEARVVVAIVVDGERIGTAVANQYRQDLAENGKGDGSHSFTFHLPVWVQNSRDHQVVVQAGEPPVEVHSSLRTVNCPFLFPEHLKAN
jgi:hypothetical protein